MNAFKEAGDDARALTGVRSWKTADVLDAMKNADFVPDWVCFQYVPQMYGHAGLCWDFSGLPGAVKKNFGWKTAVTFHEIAVPMAGGLKQRLLSFIMRLQAVRLLSGCDLAVLTCGSNAELVRRLAPGLRRAVIPVGSNIPRVPQTESKTAETVFAIFGRFTAERNYATALKVLAESLKRGRKARLFVLGDAERSNPEAFGDFMRRAGDLRVSGQVEVTGKLPAAEISKRLNASDVFLLPQTEGVSTRNGTLMAALAHGLPIVTYEPLPGHFEGHSIPSGRMVPRGDEDAFIRAALECRQEKSRENEMYYEKHFSWPAVCRLYRGAFSKGNA